MSDSSYRAFQCVAAVAIANFVFFLCAELAFAVANTVSTSVRHGIEGTLLMISMTPALCALLVAGVGSINERFDQ